MIINTFKILISYLYIMKYNKYGIIMDKEYFKYNIEEENIYLLFKGVVYKCIKHNEEHHIILDVSTLMLYTISWGLCWALKHFETLEEANQNKLLYNNVFILGQIKINYGETDIYNAELKEPIKQINVNKTNINKHYKPLGIGIQTICTTFQT